MPDSNDIQIQKLFIYDPPYSKSLADIYVGSVSEPTRLFQKLIIVLDFPRRTSTDGWLVDTIVRTAVKAFDDARQFTPELVLESTLEALNILLPTLIPKKNPRWLSELNLLIGISDRGQVHFSQVGDVQTYLAQGTGMQLVSEDPGALNPLKLFSHITSGLLNPGDALLITTSPLVDYVAEDKIKNLLLRLPPEAAVQELEALIAQAPSSVTFAAVLIKFTTEYDALAVRGIAETPPARRLPPRDAMPALGPDEQMDSSPVDDLPHPRRNIQRARSLTPRFSFGSALRSFARHALVYLTLVYRILKKIVHLLILGSQAMIFAEARARHEASIISYSEKILEQTKRRVVSFSKKNRILISIAILLCFVLLHVLLIKGQTQELASIRTSYEDTLFALTEQKQAVEDALLYGDEATAEQILLSMLEDLDKLQPLNKSQQDQIVQYRKETERDLNKVRHINIIDAPLVFSDLTSITEARVQGFAILADGSIILAADSAIYRLKDTEPEKQATLPTTAAFIAASGDTTLVIDSTQSITRVRGTETSPVTFPKHADMRSVDAATLYAGNFYLLDRSAGKIFKYEGSGANFRAGTIWLDDQGLLSKANNAAIDGNVYLTTTDGDIIKLLKGVRQQFDYHAFNPRLGSNATIYTTKESNLLYILDPENRRIAILDKQGNIKDQYTSEKFDALTSLAINASEDSLYVLNGKMIYLLAIKK